MKAKICASLLGGYSLLPESKYMISFVNRDGSVRWDKLNDIMWNVAKRGASYMRFFPVWPTEDQEGYINLLGTYPQNMGKIARLAKDQYGITLIITLLNASELRGKRKLNSRWNKKGGFDIGNGNMYEIEKYIEEIVDNTRRYSPIYEIINEPNPGHQATMALCYYKLVQMGIHHGHVMPGWDILRKETEKEYGLAYRDFRGRFVNDNEYDFLERYDISFKYENTGIGSKTVVRKNYYSTGSEKFEDILKKECWSTIHQANVSNLKKYFTHNLEPGHKVPSGSSRKMFYSFDGLMNPRPNFKDARNAADYVLYHKKSAARKGKIITEVVIGKEVGIDPYAALQGVAAAWNNSDYKLPTGSISLPELPEWLAEENETDEPGIPGVPGPEKPDHGEEIEENVEEKMDKRKLTFGIIVILALLSTVWLLSQESAWKWLGIVGVAAFIGFGALIRRLSWWWMAASGGLALVFVSSFLISGNWFACFLGFASTFTAIAVNERMRVNL